MCMFPIHILLCSHSLLNMNCHLMFLHHSEKYHDLLDTTDLLHLEYFVSCQNGWGSWWKVAWKGTSCKTSSGLNIDVLSYWPLQENMSISLKFYIGCTSMVPCRSETPNMPFSIWDTPRRISFETAPKHLNPMKLTRQLEGWRRCYHTQLVIMPSSQEM